jgi:hypothetical protein
MFSEYKALLRAAYKQALSKKLQPTSEYVKIRNTQYGKMF